jgi:hypothetical protein
MIDHRKFKQDAIKWARVVHENGLHTQCETCFYWHCLIVSTNKRVSDQPRELYLGECRVEPCDEYPLLQWQKTCPRYENLWVKSSGGR